MSNEKTTIHRHYWAKQNVKELKIHLMPEMLLHLLVAELIDLCCILSYASANNKMVLNIKNELDNLYFRCAHLS